mmetsp:Transcript_114950/g.199254  ORF Transcript_114950/g.199254 Transcript_114950/m.199254 type:complete len:697 (-) Transcript_114950:58-2148(-)
MTTKIFICLYFLVTLFHARASTETEDFQEVSDSTSLLQVDFGLHHRTRPHSSHRGGPTVTANSTDQSGSKLSCSIATTADDIFARHDFANRVAIVTGGDDGIGFAIASAFARRSAIVVIASQDKEKGELAAESIVASTGNVHVLAIPLDLTSFASIRSFVSALLEKSMAGRRLDFLVNNADTRAKGITEDGFDIEFQAKYLGHFFLTELLLPTLRSTSSPRVINLASDSANFPCAQLGAPANCLDTFWFLPPKVAQNGSAHSLSEFLLIQHAAELASREGPRIKAFSVAPAPSWQAPEVAAAVIAFCAVAPAGQVCNGCFFHRNLNLLDGLPFPRPKYVSLASTFVTKECGVIEWAMIAGDGFTRDMRITLYQQSRVLCGMRDIPVDLAKPVKSIRSPPFRHYKAEYPDASMEDGDVSVKMWNSSGMGKYNAIWGPPGFSVLEWRAGSVMPYPEAGKFWLPSDAHFYLIEGSLSYEINGSIKTMREGDVLWVAAFTPLGPFVPSAQANVTRLGQAGSDWIPSFTTPPEYLNGDPDGPWGENWDGSLRFKEYGYAYYMSQMSDQEFEGASVLEGHGESVRIPHDGLGAPAFMWFSGEAFEVWGHFHQCGSLYVSIIGEFCFVENSQGVHLGTVCLNPGEARWVRPGYFYDNEYFTGDHLAISFERDCGTSTDPIYNNESAAISLIDGSHFVFEPEIA